MKGFPFRQRDLKPFLGLLLFAAGFVFFVATALKELVLLPFELIAVIGSSDLVDSGDFLATLFLFLSCAFSGLICAKGFKSCLAKLPATESNKIGSK